MLAASKVFQKLYILELSHWTEGMPMNLFQELLHRYGLPDLPSVRPPARVKRQASRDNDGVGHSGVHLVSVGLTPVGVAVPGCTGCGRCLQACPLQALELDTRTTPITITLYVAHCQGVACRRCEGACPPAVLFLHRFYTACWGE
jgi:ferredoxin